MNFEFLLVAVIAFVIAINAYHFDGQPACKTVDELDIGIFRNTWDPTAYWKCVQLNKPAVLKRCPDETAFMESRKDCVSWDEWEWEKPEAPLFAIEEEQELEQ